MSVTGNRIVRIGPVELREEEAETYFARGWYIVTSSRIFRVDYDSKHDTYHGRIVHTQKGMTRPHRFYAMDAATVNSIFDLNLR